MKTLVPFAGLLFSAACSHAAVSLPYSNSFNTDDGAFFEGSDAQWIETGGVYRNTNSTNGSNSSATVEAIRGATDNFSMSTSFTVSDLSTSFSVGLMFLSKLDNTGAGSYYYFADITTGGDIRLYSVSNNGSASAIANTTTGDVLGALDLTETITMTLNGTFNGSGQFNVEFIVSDGTNTRTLTNNSAITPFGSGNAGNYFGFRNRNNAADQYVVNYNEFSLVPEPGAAVLGGIGALMLLGRRRLK